MAAAAPLVGHDGQTRLFAPSELRAPRRERDPALTAPRPSIVRPGREVNIAILSANATEATARTLDFAGYRTLFGPPVEAAMRAVLDATSAPASAVRVEDGEALAGAPGVLAFYAPRSGGRMAPFALADGLTLDEALSALRRAA